MFVCVIFILLDRNLDSYVHLRTIFFSFIQIIIALVLIHYRFSIFFFYFFSLSIQRFVLLLIFCSLVSFFFFFQNEFDFDAIYHFSFIVRFLLLSLFNTHNTKPLLFFDGHFYECEFFTFLLHTILLRSKEKMFLFSSMCS